MNFAFATLLAGLAASQAAVASELIAASGQMIAPIEYLIGEDETGAVLRARYHAPGIGAQSDIDTILADMGDVCARDVTRAMGSMANPPVRVIVSFSSEAIAFGEINAEVTQFFEVYRVEDGRCIWELF